MPLPRPKRSRASHVVAREEPTGSGRRCCPQPPNRTMELGSEFSFAAKPSVPFWNTRGMRARLDFGAGVARWRGDLWSSHCPRALQLGWHRTLIHSLGQESTGQSSPQLEKLGFPHKCDTCCRRWLLSLQEPPLPTCLGFPHHSPSPRLGGPYGPPIAYWPLSLIPYPL